MTGRRSRRSATTRSSALCAAIALAACGTAPPPEKIVADDYFPLSVGTRWEYVQDEGGQTERHFKAITGCAPDLALGSDCDASLARTVDAIVQESIGDSDPLESGFTYYTVEPDGIYRVLQERKDRDEDDPEVVRTYWPGFFRFPRGLVEPGRAWTSAHDVCELDTTGPDPSPPAALEHARYLWTVEALEPLELPEAGRFPRTILLRREREGSDKVKLFWFAEGVGKVLEREMDGPTMVLEERIVSWAVGDESCAR